MAPHLPPSHVGGVEVYTQTLIDALAAREQRVESVAVEHFVVGDRDGCDSWRDDTDGHVGHRLTMSVRKRTRSSLMIRHRPTEEWFDRLLTESDPDVVHLQSGYLLGAPLMVAAERQGIPVVLTIHDYWFVCPRIVLQHPDGDTCSGPEGTGKCAWCVTSDRRRFRWLDRALGGRMSVLRERSTAWQLLGGGPTQEIADRQARLRKLFGGAAAVLAPSRFLVRQMESAGLPVGRAQVSRCGMPSPARLPTAAPATLRLAYFGQIVPHKGVHLLVEALRDLPGRDVSLAIHGPLTGTDAYVARVRGQAAADARITFRGGYSRERMSELLAEADTVVVPSTWPEVAALVIQEAHGAGLPVLASRLGGSPEFVRHDVDGLLFDPDTPGDLTRQIERLLDDRTLLQRLGSAAPTPRTVDDELDALLALYASVQRPR